MTARATIASPTSSWKMRSRLLLAAWLAFAAPAAADAPERDTRTWTDGKVRITFSVPETYGSCRPRDLTDTVYTEGVPSDWRLLGRINVGYVSEGTFTILKVVPVDVNGDLALTIEYPPHSDVVRHSHGVLEYHVEPQIELFEAGGRKNHFVGGDQERAPGALGPGGQDWDIFCATTLAGSGAR